MKKFFLISFIFIFVFSLYFGNSTFALAKSDNYSSKSMVVIETTQNKILYAKDENLKLPMASTTKIATAITAIENCDDLDKEIVIPKEATNIEGSSIYLKPNEKLTMRQLLYGLMLQSGNDSAMAIALEVGDGKLESFINLMNELAKKCGAYDTNFVTPNGLDDENHYTTALDLAKITSYALKNPIFKEIVSTKSYFVPATEFYQERNLINKNKLLSSLEGCIGVKTGYTSKAGRCLVSACERDGMQVVCVVLNCKPMFEESVELINKAFNEYKSFEILPSYKFIKSIKINNGKEDFVRLYNKSSYFVVDKEKNINRYTVTYDYPESVDAPVKKEQEIGKVNVYFDNTLIFSENLCSIENVDEIETSNNIKNILDKW